MKPSLRTVSDWPGAKRVLLLVTALLFGASALRGQQNVEPPQQTNETTNQKIQELAALDRARPHDIPIGTGDLLHIDVFDVSELSRDVRVSDVGDITYPLIPGKIQVAGLTPFQLEEKMEQLLIENGLVTHPQVSVFVKEETSQPISIVGAVVKPMVYQVVRPTTLLELLADAGGITDLAGSVVMITRATGAPGPSLAAVSAEPKSGAESQTITIRLQDLLESGDPALQHSDLWWRCCICTSSRHRICHGRGNRAAWRLRTSGSRTANHGPKSSGVGSWIDRVCEGRRCCDHAKQSSHRSKRDNTGSR